MDSLIRSLLKPRSQYFKFFNFGSRQPEAPMPTALMNLPADDIENDLRGALSSRSMMIALEPRIVFDAAAVATVEAVDQVAANDAAHTDQANNDHDNNDNDNDHHNDGDHHGDSDSDSHHSIIIPPDLRSGHEVVFVDAGVQNYETLLQGMDPQAIVVVLDPNVDGIQQISDVLSQLENVPAVHIISHGTDGQINLGSTHLGYDNLNAYTEQLSQWSQALTQDADILIYGCEVADNDQGANFVQGLANITGADIAASNDLTGDAALGGDWDLEVSSGSIESHIIISQFAQDNFHDTLSIQIVGASDVNINEDGSFDLTNLNLFSTEDGTVPTEGGSNDTFNTIQITITSDNSIAGSWVDNGAGGVGGGVTAMFTENVGFVISGMASDVQQALSLLQWVPSANEYGTNNFSIQLDDLTAGETTYSGFQANIAAVNDAPINTLQTSSVSTNEDTPYVFNSGHGSLIYVGDVDSNTLTTTLTVTHGTINLTGGSGVSITSGANGSNTVTIQGSAAQINAAVNGLTYTPTGNYNGAASLTVLTSDGVASDSDVINITVNSVNDAPINTIQDNTVTTNEDTSYVFSNGNGSLITVADIDNATLTTTLTVTHGTITLTGGSGVSITGGSNGSNTVTIQGTSAQINAAMNGMSYAPTANYNGSATLSVSTTDGSLTDNDSVTITVSPVNDAPVISGSPSFATAYEDGGASLIDLSNISFADVDDNSSVDIISVTLSVAHGTLYFDSGFNSLDSVVGNGGSSVTFYGTRDAINDLFNTEGSIASGQFSYTADPDFNGDDTFTVEVNDQGNTGSGGAKTDSESFTLHVDEMNDAPYASTNTGMTVNEDSGSTVITGARLSYGDIDNTHSEVIYTITSVPSGGTISNNGVSLTIGQTFTQEDINNGLLTFTPNANANGAMSFGFTVEDSVGTSGGSGTFNITVTPVNDAPVNTIQDNTVTTNEDTSYVFSSGNNSLITVADVDGAGVTLTTTLTVTHGTITLTGGSGVSITGGSNGSNTVTIQGTAAQINAAMNGMSYAPTANFNGSATLSVSTTDGSLTDNDSVTITVDAVNDAPVISGVPSTVSLNEDGITDIDLSTLVFTDVDDPSSDIITVTFTVAHGVINVASSGNSVDSLSGDGTNTITVTGTVNAINSFFQTEGGSGIFTYTPDANYNGTDPFNISVDDGSLTDSDSFDIIVAPVNDAPVNTVPGAQTMNEDATLTFNGTISVADVDGDTLTTTLSVGHGTIAIAGGSGVSIVGGANGSGTITIQGTAAQINNALNGLVYTPTANYNGSDSLDISTDDGTVSDDDSIAITVNAVNDAPINTIEDNTVSTNEDTTYTFNSGNNSLITVADIDNNTLTTTLTVTNGTITIAGGSGVSITSGANGTNAVTIQGTAAQINAAMNGMSYAPTANFNGSATLSVSTTDGSLTDNDSVTITVGAVNDAPVNTVPGAQTTDEDTDLVFAGNITVADVDGGTLTTTLTINHGIITLGDASGVVITAGADGSNTVTIQGSAAAINAALNGLTYTPTDQYSGSATLSIATNDGTITDTDNINITVTAVADQPLNFAAVDVSGNEDTDIALNLNIESDDTDGSEALSMILTGLGSGTIVDGSGNAIGTDNGGGSWTLTKAEIDAGVYYRPAPDFNGVVNVTATGYVVESSNNDTATDSTTFDITVNAVNDAPINTIQDNTVSTNEDTAYTFNSGNGSLITVADIDGAGVTLTTTLTVTHGTITIAGGSGVSITAGADGSNTVTIQGTAAQINAAMNGMQYSPTANYNGAATLTVLTNDGTATDSDSVTITVAAVNDAPINSVPGAQSTDEDTALTFSVGNSNLISISDADGDTQTVTLTVTNGTLTLSQTTGLSFSSGDGTGDTTMTFSGSIADINAALAGMQFNPTANYHGAANLQIITNDGTTTDTDNVSITVDSVNDAINLTNNGGTVNEDTILTLTNSMLLTTDVEDAAADIIYTVTALPTNGTLFINGIAAGVNDTFTQDDIASGLITYVSDANYHGADSFEFDVADQDGSSQTSQTFSITVSSVNDAPINSVPGAQSTNEDTGLTFSVGNGNLISISDVDGTTQTVTLTVTNGTLNLSQTTGLSFSSGDGTGDTTMTFSGSIADINAALAGMQYNPTANYNGAANLQIVTNDGTTTDTDSVAITVSAVNDAPEITANSSTYYYGHFDGFITFGSGSNIITISDIDAGSSVVRLTLATQGGTATFSSGVGGITTISGGNGTSAWVVEGTLANLQNLLNNLTVTGSDTVTITISDKGNTGSGGTLTDSVVITIAEDPLPVITLPSNPTTLEDTPIAISGFSITDNDPNAIKTLRITNPGVYLTMADTTGINYTFGFNGMIGMTEVQGTVANLQNFLNSMTASMIANTNGTFNITFQIYEVDISHANQYILSLDVTPVDDAPVNGIPAAQTVAEDTALVFSGSNGNMVSAGDVDNTHVRVTISVGNGDLTLSQLTGLTFVSGDGANDGTMTFYGTKASVSAALNGLTYMPTANYNGADTLTITTYGTDASGVQQGASDTDTVGITVTAVNDAPINTIQDNTVTTNEDAAYVFNNVNGSLITVADIDSSILTTTLTVTHGTITIAGGSGVSITSGASGTSTVTIQGTAAQINAAMNGMQYSPTANYNGSATLSVSTTDGSLTDNDTVTITVDAVNDAPINSVPGAQSTDEDTALVFSVGNGNLISISDVDGGTQTVTLTVTHGALTLSQTTGLSFLNGDGTSDTTMTFSGSVADINAALAGMQFNPTANYNGAANLQIVTNDGTTTDTDSVAITVNSVNDAIVLVNNGATMDADDTLTLDATMLSTTDVEDGASDIIYTVTTLPTHGTLYINGIAANLNDTFTQADIANGLITYVPTTSYTGSDNFHFDVADQDGSSQINKTFTIDVGFVNVAPTFSSFPSDTVINAGQAFSFTIITADGNGDARTIVALSSLPSWLSFVDNGNGTATLSGTPNGFAAAASYTLQFRVEDSHSATATQSFNLSVKAQSQVNIIHDTTSSTSSNHSDGRNIGNSSVTDNGHVDGRLISKFSIFTDQIKKAITYISDAIYDPGKVDGIYADRQIIPEDNGAGLRAILQDKFDIAQPDRQSLIDTTGTNNGSIESVRMQDVPQLRNELGSTDFNESIDTVIDTLSDTPDLAVDRVEGEITDAVSQEPQEYQTLEEQIELQSSRFEDRKSELMKAALDN